MRTIPKIHNHLPSKNWWLLESCQGVDFFIVLVYKKKLYLVDPSLIMLSFPFLSSEDAASKYAVQYIISKWFHVNDII